MFNLDKRQNVQLINDISEQLNLLKVGHGSVLKKLVFLLTHGIVSYKLYISYTVRNVLRYCVNLNKCCC